MKFKIDENLPVEVSELLVETGYDTKTIHDQDLIGSVDPEIATICQEEGRALVTLDTDFADIKTYPPSQYSGLIVLRLRRQDKLYVLNIIKKIIPLLSTEPLEKRLWIVEESRIRIRS